MDRESTIAEIEKLLRSWRDDMELCADAAQVFDQMPITLCEQHRDIPLNFDDLVRFASHDLFRAAAIR